MAVHGFDAQFDAGLLEFLRQSGQFGAQGLRAEQVEHLPQQLQVDRAHGVDTRAAGVKFGLLLLDAGAHVLDHRHVFAAQAAQFGHLFGQVAPANVQRTPSLDAQLADARTHYGTQHALALPHHAFSQSQLQQRQAAGFQQRRVVGHFSHQAFLRRHGDHMRRWQTQDLGRGGALPVNLRLDLLRRAQRVPQRVDLVEHHQPGVARGVLGDQVFTPDGQI